MTRTADYLFPAEQRFEEGVPTGATRFTLVRAVEVWFYTSAERDGADVARTVGEAAEIFNVTPAFLAEAIDSEGGMFFIAEPHADPAARVLDCDGL